MKDHYGIMLFYKSSNNILRKSYNESKLDAHDALRIMENFMPLEKKIKLYLNLSISYSELGDNEKAKKYLDMLKMSTKENQKIAFDFEEVVLGLEKKIKGIEANKDKLNYLSLRRDK